MDVQRYDVINHVDLPDARPDEGEQAYVDWMDSQAAELDSTMDDAERAYLRDLAESEGE